MTQALKNLDFYMSGAHPCSYLEDQETITLLADPNAPLSTEIYGQLSQLGFRRSGNHIYRPHCPECHACIPLRIRVADYHYRRNDRRVLTKNSDLELTLSPPLLTNAHFALYRDYIQETHPGGGMAMMSDQEIVDFFFCDWANSQLFEIHLQQELIGVAIIDRLPNAFSSVYTFYSPKHSHRSLGTFAILKTVELALQQGLQWLYLGYWIEQCSKMNYKIHFRPFEYFYAGRWHKATSQKEICLHPSKKQPI